VDDSEKSPNFLKKPFAEDKQARKEGGKEGARERESLQASRRDFKA